MIIFLRALWCLLYPADKFTHPGQYFRYNWQLVFSAMSGPSGLDSADEKLDKWQRQPPTFDRQWDIEYSIHGIPPRILKELKQIFTGVNLESGLVVPTFQVRHSFCYCKFQLGPSTDPART